MTRPMLFVAALLIWLACLLTWNWSTRDERANAFVKECNARGGIAKIYDGMLQCVSSMRAAT